MIYSDDLVSTKFNLIGEIAQAASHRSIARLLMSWLLQQDEVEWEIKWLGKERTEVVRGPTISEALTRAGYGHGAVSAMDFYKINYDVDELAERTGMDKLVLKGIVEAIANGAS